MESHKATGRSFKTCHDTGPITVYNPLEFPMELVIDLDLGLVLPETKWGAVQT